MFQKNPCTTFVKDFLRGILGGFSIVIKQCWYKSMQGSIKDFLDKFRKKISRELQNKNLNNSVEF